MVPSDEVATRRGVPPGFSPEFPTATKSPSSGDHATPVQTIFSTPLLNVHVFNVGDHARAYSHVACMVLLGGDSVLDNDDLGPGGHLKTSREFKRVSDRPEVVHDKEETLILSPV